MEKKIFKKVILAFLLLFVGFSLLPGAVAARDDRTTQVVVFEPSQNESKDFYLLKGQEVEVKGIVNGDVYVLGGQITIQGSVNGDVMALGGNISVPGEIKGNLRAIGAQVFIRGEVDKNVTVIANDFEVALTGEIKGGVASVASNVYLNGPIKGAVKIASGKTVFGNTIGSDVDVIGDVNLTKSTVVSGNFNYHSNNDAVIESDASVSGKLTKTPLPEFRKADRFAKAEKIPSKIFGFLAALLVGYVLIRKTPKIVKEVTSNMNKNYLKTVWHGFLFLVLSPLASILLAITIIGIPLSVINLGIYFLCIYLAKIFVAYWLGQKIMKGGKKVFLNFTAGLFLIYIVYIIPFLGDLGSFAVIVFGLGATFASMKKLFQIAKN